MRFFKFSTSRKLLFTGISIAAFSASAFSTTDFLREFQQNPIKMMQKLPMEVDSYGNLKSRGSIDTKKVQEAIEFKTTTRELIIDQSTEDDFHPLGSRFPLAGIPSGPDERDQAERLVDPGTTLVINLRDMQALNLMNIALPVAPWADTYWPTYKGSIADRYADTNFSTYGSWEENFAQMQTVPVETIIASNNVTDINNLSPAEKYDFVMGDSDYTLTHFAWNKGANTPGGVATWEGICHGWSSASHLDQPIMSQSVVVMSPTGVPVTFYPEDLKGLTSMLWANASVNTRFVGNTCKVANPPKNQYGRITNPDCFDPNPATWHLAIVNQFGLNKRSFVLDATYDIQVWNFPLAAAKYRYFNLNTHQETDNLNAAVIPIAELRTDYFKEFRSPQAKNVVGIAMDVTYTVEIQPTHSLADSRPTRTMRLMYDLELDESYNVIGGEWYSNAHPDFIWTHDAKAQALAPEDSGIIRDAWNNKSAVPANWAPLAKRASASGIPLYSFIKKVIESTTPPTE